MNSIAYFSNAFRRRAIKAKLAAPHLQQGLSYTDAIRAARNKSSGITTNSPVVNTLQSRSYMTDPLDLTYVHSNLSKMNRDAPTLAGEVSTIANRLENNRAIAPDIKTAKQNWLSTRGLKPSELGLAPEGSAMDLTSQVLLPPQRPNDRQAIGGITAHTHPMMDTHAPSVIDINAMPNMRLVRNYPSSVVKELVTGKTPLNYDTVSKYDPYFAANAPFDNFIFHQKSPTRSAVVHYPDTDAVYNDLGKQLKKTSGREAQNKLIKNEIDTYSTTPINQLSGSQLDNLGVTRGQIPDGNRLQDLGINPEAYVLNNAGKNANIVNSVMSHPDVQQSYMKIPKMLEASGNLNQGIQPSIQDLKSKAFKSEQTNLIRATYKAAKDIGIPYSQLGTIDKNLGKNSIQPRMSATVSGQISNSSPGSIVPAKNAASNADAIDYRLLGLGAAGLGLAGTAGYLGYNSLNRNKE